MNAGYVEYAVATVPLLATATAFAGTAYVTLGVIVATSNTVTPPEAPAVSSLPSSDNEISPPMLLALLRRTGLAPPTS